jgi:hypothetical protein
LIVYDAIMELVSSDKEGGEEDGGDQVIFPASMCEFVSLIPIFRGSTLSLTQHHIS